MGDELIPIRKMCLAFDVTPRALRFYEDQGLLAPVRKGNARWYGPADRAQLGLVLRAKKYGLTIEEIRQLMQLYDPETGQFTQLHIIRETAKRQLDLLSRRKRDLSLSIDDLTDDLKLAARWLSRKDMPQAH